LLHRDKEADRAFPDRVLFAVVVAAVFGADLSEGNYVWLTEYGVDAPSIACSFWQWSAEFPVTGAAGACDCEVYLGTVEGLMGIRMV